MAITAAQVSATKKSRATQAARNTTRIAMAVRVTARARGSKGSPALSTDRRSFLLSMVADWRGGQFRARRHAHSASSLTPAEGYPENISEGGSWRFPPSQSLRPGTEATFLASADVDDHQLPISFPPRGIPIHLAPGCCGRGVKHRLHWPWARVAPADPVVLSIDLIKTFESRCDPLIAVNERGR